MSEQITPQQSSVPGVGNKLVSYFKSGYIVSTTKKVEIFNFKKNDASPAHARFLTNLSEAGKISNSIDFEGVAVGLRCTKIGATAPTAAEIHDLKKYLASLEVVITIGGDKKPAVKLSGLQFTSPEEFVSTTGTIASGNTAIKGEIALPVPVRISRGWDIQAEVEATLTTIPATLVVALEEWAVQVILIGFEQTF